MPELEYVHLDDSTPCIRSVTMAGGEWKCLTHGRRVRRREQGAGELLMTAYGVRIDDALESYVSEGTSLVDQAKASRDKVADREDADIRRALQRVPAAEHEALARQVVMAGVGNLRLVGWYCAGGHVVEHFQGHAPRSPDPQELATPSIRLEDPCAYGVPVYVVERAEKPREPGTCEGCTMTMYGCRSMMRMHERPCCSECEHRS